MIKVGSIVTRKGKGPTRFVVLAIVPAVTGNVYRVSFKGETAPDFLLWADDLCEVQS